MICPCFEIMVEKLRDIGLFNAGFQEVDINIETGEASLVIPVVVNTPLIGRPNMMKREVIGVIGMYCPFCGRYLGEEEGDDDA